SAPTPKYRPFHRVRAALTPGAVTETAPDGPGRWSDPVSGPHRAPCSPASGAPHRLAGGLSVHRRSGGARWTAIWFLWRRPGRAPHESPRLLKRAGCWVDTRPMRGQCPGGVYHGPGNHPGPTQPRRPGLYPTDLSGYPRQLAYSTGIAPTPQYVWPGPLTGLI